MLLADRERAHANRQISAAVRATEVIGRLLGMFVDRREIRTSPNPLDELEYAELVALCALIKAGNAHQAS